MSFRGFLASMVSEAAVALGCAQQWGAWPEELPSLPLSSSPTEHCGSCSISEALLDPEGAQLGGVTLPKHGGPGIRQAAR